MKVTTEVKVLDWKSFLQKVSSATIYHSPEWKKFLEKTFGYKPYYLFSVNESDEIAGMLPLMHVKSRLLGSRLSCMPFAHRCGYIGDNVYKNNLIEAAVKIFNDSNIRYLEIRDAVRDSEFKNINAFSTYILELSGNVGEVWKRADKGSVRWAIKKSQKNLSVDATKNIEDLKEFYELNCVTKKDKGVPCHTWKFFKNLFDILQDHISLYTARYKDEIIGGGIMDYFKENVLYAYGAANPDYLKLYPYNAFIWKSIEDACLKGYKYYDFGSTSYDNTGLANFKRKWGSVEHKLCYSYHPYASSSALIEAYGEKKLSYKFGGYVIRHSPMILYKKFSDLIFREVG